MRDGCNCLAVETDRYFESPMHVSACPAQSQTRGLTCRVLTDFEDLRQLSGDWERLWEANPNRQIFNKFSWIESWWAGFGAKAQLFSPAVYDDGKCVGILPLRVEGHVLRFIGDPLADYNDLICDPEMKAVVLESAIAALDEAPIRWESCTLNNVSESSLIVAARDELSQSLRSRTEAYVYALCPSVMLGDDRAETLAAILAKATVSRRMRQLEKLGTLTFRHIEDRDQAREHLPSLFDQHVRCRALAGIRSKLLDQESRNFFAALVENLSPQNDLRFSVLELDRRPIAYNFGFQLDGKFMYYTPTYDIDFFDLSPGNVLLRHLFLYARDNGIQEFDFTIGDQNYKTRYANQTKRNYELALYPRTTKGKIAQAALAAKERLRRYPRAFRAAKSILEKVRTTAHLVYRLVRRDGLAGLAAKVAVRIFRSAIYARDEDLVITPKGSGFAPAAHRSTFREATLRDLTDAAVNEPELFGNHTLHDLRERMKKGHTPFVVLANGNIVHVMWLRIEDRIVSAELDEHFAVELGRPVGIMYDARTPLAARGKGFYPTAVTQLAAHIRSLGLEPWAYVRLNNAASRRGLEKVGIDVRYRMVCYSWFHWIRRCVILPPQVC
jgi:CelD/BcsL family acetyltransferase involved in cellulose biosynthesis